MTLDLKNGNGFDNLIGELALTGELARTAPRVAFGGSDGGETMEEGRNRLNGDFQSENVERSVSAGTTTIGTDFDRTWLCFAVTIVES